MMVERAGLVRELRAERGAAPDLPARAAFENSLCRAHEPRLAVVANLRDRIDTALRGAVVLRPAVEPGTDERFVVVLRGRGERYR